MKSQNCRGKKDYEGKEIGNDNKRNILFSLEYLLREAQRKGYKELCSILKNALHLALQKEKGRDTGFSAEEECDEDTANILNFLVRYDEASPEVRREVLAAIERFESARKSMH